MQILVVISIQHFILRSSSIQRESHIYLIGIVHIETYGYRTFVLLNSNFVALIVSVQIIPLELGYSET